MDLRLQRLCSLKVLGLQRLGQLDQLTDRILFDQVAVVEVVVEDVEALLDVRHVRFEGGRRAGFDAGEFGREDGVDGLRGGRDVGAVAGS
jgi:hypothetical protein